ncbi:CXADR-like membrane protein-like [Scleropages formosus]|uniref:CXADR-like membrane protein-like n=1 Tax=Scleropages formosus TaxID=113540 RepID=A0A0N8K205_SCLFO|nr:CXADR-like membrane protein-like [Scleropages formosus]
MRFICFSPVLLSLLRACAQTEMKRVVGDNATLPCHHQFQSDSQTLDIEWLLQKPNSQQRVVITYFGGNVYYPSDSEPGRATFARDYLQGDASLLIGDLTLGDTGDYTCKVKNGGKYLWSTVSLKVLDYHRTWFTAILFKSAERQGQKWNWNRLILKLKGQPSKPQCWMEGRLLEGSDVKLSCRSADGSEPIHYKWERVLDKGKSIGKLPPMALIDFKNPEIVTLRNLTQESTGVYKCTASNDVGEENCIIEVTIHYVRGIGVVAGAVVGVSFGVLLLILIVWLVFRKKEKRKYEEEETPNEIREDAEAPKAKLVKPNSLSSSRSGSSRSGASSTQSMVHNTAPRGHRPRPPAGTALKENGQPPSFGQAPPAYTQVVSKTSEADTPKFTSKNMSLTADAPAVVPAQTKAFQTV